MYLQPFTKMALVSTRPHSQCFITIAHYQGYHCPGVCVCAYSASSLVLCGYNVQHWHILNMHHHHTVQYRCTIQCNIDISKVHCTQSMYAYNNYTHLTLEAKDRCKVHT